MITVASYNIHSCVGNDRQRSCPRIISVLEEINADVVALQEVSIDAGESVLECFVERHPEFYFCEGPTLFHEKGRYGNAILSRLPFNDVQRLDLSVPGREARGALDVRFEHDGRHYQVIATHLGLAPAERRLQIQSLLMHIQGAAANPERFSILMGDLNEWFLWGRPLRWLKRYFGRTQALATFPAKRPLFALDRIWVAPSQCLQCLTRHQSANALLASDHLPLVATIKASG